MESIAKWSPAPKKKSNVCLKSNRYGLGNDLYICTTAHRINSCIIRTATKPRPTWDECHLYNIIFFHVLLFTTRNYDADCCSRSCVCCNIYCQTASAKIKIPNLPKNGVICFSSAATLIHDTRYPISRDNK